jgi:hypothetical protein
MILSRYRYRPVTVPLPSRDRPVTVPLPFSCHRDSLFHHRDTTVPTVPHRPSPSNTVPRSPTPFKTTF